MLFFFEACWSYSNACYQGLLSLVIVEWNYQALDQLLSLINKSVSELVLG